MSFAHPLALLLLLLLIPVLLLYWLRVRVPRETIGTGLFWEKALAEEKLRSRWQSWRPRISLPLEMLVVVLLALAAAGPQIPPPKRTVLIIDNSATMRATDVQPTRLDAAKAVARRKIDGLRWCDQMAVVEVCPSPLEIQPITSDKALLAEAVDNIKATGEPPEIDWAVKLGRQIHAGDQPPPRIVLVTDACSREASKKAQDSGVEVLRVGTPAPNLAITCLTARRNKTDPAKCQVFVEVRNQGDQSAQGSLAWSVNEQFGPPVPFSIVKDGRWQHIFEQYMPAAARFNANLEPGDAYVFDDSASLDIPAGPAVHRARLIADAGSGLKGILAANPRVQLITGSSNEKAIQVIEGKTPPSLPSGPVLIFTTSACDLWKLGPAVADPLITHIDEHSPITADLRFDDAYLPEARQLQFVDAVRATAAPILWTGTTPLGYAIDRREGRVVVICGDLATSNLTLQAAFPQLIAQSLDWLDAQPSWKDEIIVAAQPVDRSNAIDGIDIRVPAGIGSEVSAMVIDKPQMPLWIVPAALGAVLLVIQWCLYQRRWTS